MPQITQLRYTVAGFSEYSGPYTAENIMYDRPHDQASRWSSGKDNATLGPSWLLLELESPSVLESVTFGKFLKVHPCNMKDFEIQIGMSKEYMSPVLHASLKNDTKNETFPIRNKNKDGITFPAKFVKILALSAHGNNFNTSIWHVALAGKIERKYVQRVVDEYETNREALAMRHILKHLRQRRYLTSYRQLLSRSGVQLEHPIVSELYDAIVLRGDWSQAELCLQELARSGLLDDFILSCVPRACWKRLRGTDANGDTPSKRGGHAMCMDVDQGLIYLFGGYDGRKSLDDFWVYNVREERWNVISHSSSKEEKNGPGPRACHKMIFDQKSGCIYLLGRLGDSDFQTVPESSSTSDSTARDAPVRSAWSQRRSVDVTTTPRPAPTSGASTPVPASQPAPAAGPSRTSPSQDYFSELHRYRTRGIDQGRWELLNHDTGGIGGPKLIYDHQLALDSDKQTLYVHGGRVVDGEWNVPKFSGMYSYDLRSGKWTNIQISPSESNFSPRFGHSMLLEPHQRKLFIFAGQKEDYLSDMWEFDISTRVLNERFHNVTTAGGPEACFAQRAVIDPVLQEIYVFAGLTKRSLQSSRGLSVSLLKYDSYPGTWMRVPVAEQQDCRSQSHLQATASSVRQSQPSLKRQRSEEDANDNDGDSASDKAESQTDDGEPVARCACQVVYDAKSQTFYLFGGNAGLTRRDTVGTDTPEAEERLDDFWSMKLERPSREEIVRRAIFETRTQRFKELCEDASPVSALSFLQTEVSSVVNHADHDEAAEFRSLLSHLFARPPVGAPALGNVNSPVQPTSVRDPAAAAATPVDDRAVFDMDPGTPSSESSSSSSRSGSGEWTCELKERTDVDEDTTMSDAPTLDPRAPPAAVAPGFESEIESVGTARTRTREGPGTGPDDPQAHEVMHSGDKSLTDVRFAQRTAVFEALLRFVSKKGHTKQPDGLLVDLLSNLQ